MTLAVDDLLRNEGVMCNGTEPYKSCEFLGVVERALDEEVDNVEDREPLLFISAGAAGGVNKDDAGNGMAFCDSSSRTFAFNQPGLSRRISNDRFSTLSLNAMEFGDKSAYEYDWGELVVNFIAAFSSSDRYLLAVSSSFNIKWPFSLKSLLRGNIELLSIKDDIDALGEPEYQSVYVGFGGDRLLETLDPLSELLSV